MPRTREEWIEICKTCEGGYIATPGRERMYDNSVEFVNFLHHFAWWQDDDVLVDIGCANGRIPLGLAGRHDVEYYGFDVVWEPVAFCKRVFADYPRFHFTWSDVQNDRYNKGGKLDPAVFRFPPCPAADVVFAHSVFVHMHPLITCAQYIREAARILKPGGRFHSTWYVAPPYEVGIVGNLHQVTYPREEVERLLESYFTITRVREGKVEQMQQWEVLCEKL